MRAPMRSGVLVLGQECPEHGIEEVNRLPVLFIERTPGSDDVRPTIAIGRLPEPEATS